MRRTLPFSSPARLTATALAVCLGAAGLASAEASSAEARSAGREAIDWRPCSAERHPELAEAGAECGYLAVPLDHANPQGQTVEIAVSRIRATADPDERRGILLANPGGPGGPGLDYPLALRPALGEVADRYDLIGFDPRFVGDSSPISCAPSDAVAAPPWGYPRTESGGGSHRELFEASVRAARELARRCGEPEGNAELLAHASSRNVARDMDAIRAALGEATLSYYGVSYGADLGAVYTQLFPDRVDRIVLDSSTDPALTQYELFQESGPPAEAGLDEWAAWAADRHDEYRLGRTAARVRAAVERLVAVAERRPIAIDGYRVDASQLRLILRQFVQHEENDPTLARVVRDLLDAAAGRDVDPDPALAAMLELLNSPELDEFFAVSAFTMCGDAGWPAGGWPADPETYWRATQDSRATQPVFGPFANAISPCPFWPAEPAEPGTTIDNDVPVLMLQALRDNNTPYSGGVALHEALDGSRLLTADIRGHGVYARATDGNQPVPCADQAVNAYLAGGPLPESDLRCGE
ncbi:alpha/beta fold hydrolase [Streptomyces sp. B6B3]|uniref:alpha/beta hydrolase n=1 Tax=Streptomyces sp. B6B3 TaxID=3153570 RepID=UPI00325C93DE